MWKSRDRLAVIEMYASNKLVVMRFILLPLMIAGLYVDSIWARCAALVLTVFALASDKVDGYFARKHNQVTPFGDVFDRINDKIQVSVFFIALLDIGLLPMIIVALNIFREFFMEGVRILAQIKGKHLRSEKTGKYKAALQMLTVVAALVFAIWTYSPGVAISAGMTPLMLDIVVWCGVAAVAMGMYSLILFIYRDWRLLIEGA